jgi:competence protein ComGC
MYRGSIFQLLLLLLVSLALLAQDAPKQKKEASRGKSSAAALTGCVDQQDGQYVLVNDQTLTPIANLEAEGFPTEGFAKHMGHKVTVRGSSNSGNSRPVFRVRSIETISDTCAPQSK